ncbi:methyltransferase domain-containing protein [Planomonospora sp. ID67723]|uniref:class I SAM-dependent methyltransferase n=1 Tax=Planomonospora sp. ID67723 TaxID=2738134 RepID=UPI0018C44EAD|nr:class I SAM-dependent methyltransferase [Planomonospora sp. ID67723]MBG0830410.1 methyltransferase domain-containing protein [Planomonospora sp. ID67723]
MSAAELEELKSRQQKTWASGDYGKIAWLTVPIADVLCDAADLRAGSTVLDVATGTGHVALAAARRFCAVTGIDYVPALLEQARRRAEAEDLEIEFREADAESLPFADASFDYVLSAIGVMFTADHQRAAGELLRVCRPGGRVGLASWTPAGFVGEILRTVSGHAPPPPAARPPTRWGEEGTVRELFGDGVSALTFVTAHVTQRFLSPEHFADFFVTNYGPTLKAAERLDDAGRRAFRDDLAAIAAKSNRTTDGTVISDWEYQISVATRV